MADFVGHDIAVATQRRLRDMHPEIAKNPALANGGRILNVLEPDVYGWDKIRDYVLENKYVSLTMVPKDTTLAKAREVFGDAAELPYWEAFTGRPETVVPACEKILQNAPLPDGWKLQSLSDLSDETLQNVQDLSGANGVAPTPAYYMRGAVMPSLTTCLWDKFGTLAGCANATMRYHPDSRLADALFAGGVAVAPSHRRKGLGSLINAALLRDSEAAFHWKSVLEQARNTNHASCGMIRKCGLVEQAGVVTIGINLSGTSITR